MQNEKKKPSLFNRGYSFVASLLKTTKNAALVALVGFVGYGTFMWNKSRDEGNRNRSVPTEKSVREAVNEAVQDFKESQEDTLEITDFSQKTDNILLQELEGKEFDDWAQGLEDNLGLSIDAEMWRDIANGTQEHSTKSEQDMILSVMGGKDANGNQNITRDDVIEVKEKYEKTDSLKNKTSFHQSDFDMNSSDMGLNTKSPLSPKHSKVPTFTV